MDRRVLTPAQKTEECFLSGLDSKQTLLHAVRAYDPVTSSIDEFYVSDWALREVCRPRSHTGNDLTDQHFEIAASMFRAYRQAESAGYSDTSFVSGLKTETRKHKWTLFVVTGVPDSGSHFCIMTEPLGESSGDLRLWCRTMTPLPHRVLAAAESLVRFVPCKPSWAWLHQRWMIASSPDPRGNIARAAPPHDQALLIKSTQEYGDPPDLFSYMANAMTLAGYELIRRMIS